MVVGLSRKGQVLLHNFGLTDMPSTAFSRRRIPLAVVLCRVGLRRTAGLPSYRRRGRPTYCTRRAAQVGLSVRGAGTSGTG